MHGVDEDDCVLVWIPTRSQFSNKDLTDIKADLLLNQVLTHWFFLRLRKNTTVDAILFPPYRFQHLKRKILGTRSSGRRLLWRYY
jgi:hypothetical protein